MCFGMFSFIPVPHIWDEESKAFIMPAFPFVGLVIGFCWWGMATLLQGVSIFLSSAVLTVLPFLLTGFIHLDGFMDTSDSLFSRKELSEKRKILKDSHVGAFSVIMLAVLFLFTYSSFLTVLQKSVDLLPLVFIPIVSRSLVGLVILLIPSFSKGGFAQTFQQNKKTAHIVFLFITYFFTIGLFIFLFSGLSLLLIGVMTSTIVLLVIYLTRQFQGINGDICGFVLVAGELSVLITLGLC